MAKLSKIRIDPTAEVEGVWTTYFEDIRLKVARLNNAAHREYLKKLGRPHQTQISHGTLDNKVIEEMSREAVAHTILLDWENVLDDDGSELRYSPALGNRLFNDPEYYDLFEFVVKFAARNENYRTEYLQGTAGNSSSESDGTPQTQNS